MTARTITRKMDAAYFQQLRRAEILMRIHHEKLLESGHVWDGMDGYQAPAGFTKQDGDRLWNEAIDAAKAVVTSEGQTRGL